MELSPQEIRLIEKIRKTDRITDLKIQRNSAEPFDITLKGTSEGKYHFISGLKLHAIRTLTVWCDPLIAQDSDYPKMVADGDWSGIRDSKPETIDRIFRKYVLNT